jgi:hypothetical protein
MITRLLFIIAILSLLLASCAPAASPAGRDNSEAAPPVAAPEEPAAEAGGFGEGAVPGQPAPDSQTTERLVIKNARMEIVVDQPDESMERIGQMAESMGGYIVNANLYQSFLDDGQEVPRASITVRVPAERLTEALERIRSESDQLPRNETIDSQDVTSEYTDLESRLRNLEAAEAQLQQIMEDANRTEDVLNVYNQLTQVREQIEVIKGQMQYYEQSAALSAISVELIANAAVQPITIGGWEPVGVAKQAIEALINALQVLASVAIWLVLFLIPVLVVIVLPVYLIVMLLLRWRARRRSRLAAPPPAPTSS